MSMNLQTAYSETPVIALQGQLVGKPVLTVAGYQAEASTHIPFGSPLVLKPSGRNSDIDSLLPANSTDEFRGILYRTDSYAPYWTDSQGNTHGELASDGVVPGTMLDVLSDGIVWVTCTTGCAPGDRLYIAYNATGATYTAVGQLGNAAEAGHAIDATTKGEWLTTATAGGLAQLRVMAGNK